MSETTATSSAHACALQGKLADDNLLSYLKAKKETLGQEPAALRSSQPDRATQFGEPDDTIFAEFEQEFDAEKARLDQRWKQRAAEWESEIKESEEEEVKLKSAQFDRHEARTC